MKISTRRSIGENNKRLRSFKERTCKQCILSFTNSNSRMRFKKELNLLKVKIRRKQKRGNINQLSKSKRKNKRRNIRYSNCSKTCKPANLWLAQHEDRLRNPKRTLHISKEIMITTSGTIST